MATVSPSQSEITLTSTTPEKTILWIEAIVRWAHPDGANVRLLPDVERGNSLLQIHRGDMIQVRTDLKHNDWVPCRVGHVTGWLNISDVKLIQTGAPPTKEVVRLQTPPPQAIDVETQRKATLIQKLIRFFK
jgi:hypothetical protein